jgi:DNA-binding response OmpR family regulator
MISPMADKKAKPKILIVEDDKYYSHTLRLKFESLDFEVSLAENGKKMLEKLESYTPDIILLDLIMPVMSGFEALEKLRERGTNLNSKIIVLSNLGQDEDVEKAKQMGVSEYVIKTNASIQEVVDLVQKKIKN